MHSYSILCPKDPVLISLKSRAGIYIIHSFIQQIMSSLVVTGYRVVTQLNGPCLANDGKGGLLSRIAQCDCCRGEALGMQGPGKSSW